MTLHRFVHLGDLHLGPNSRNPDRIAALKQAVDEQDYPGVSAWLWPGDLNHGRMGIEDRNVLAHYLQRMADRAPVVLCYGNHDLPGDLDVFAKLKATWPIYVVSRPTVLRVPLATIPDSHASIFVLPYPTRAGLVAAGTPSACIVDAARQALDVIFMDAAEQLRVAVATGDIAMMIGHVNVAGSITSSGQPNIGSEIEIDHSMLQRLPSGLYIGLNHIHRAQCLLPTCATYAGSMCRLDWGETEPKRYLVVEYDGGEPGHAVVSRDLDVAPMFHVEGDLARSGFVWHIVGCACGGCSESKDHPLDWRGTEVRVRYRFAAHEKSVLDESLVRAPFAGAKRLELDPIAVRDRAIRRPEVAAATTVGEKVAAFVGGMASAWTPSLDTKFAALQGPDGAAFLTTVAQGLSASQPPIPSGPTSRPAGPAVDADRTLPQEVLL